MYMRFDHASNIHGYHVYAFSPMGLQIQFTLMCMHSVLQWLRGSVCNIIGLIRVVACSCRCHIKYMGWAG